MAIIEKKDFLPLFVVGVFAVLYYLNKHVQSNLVTANAAYIHEECGLEV